MGETGIISAISRHRFDIDGVGIRTLIVFSGCPLRCKYCINSYTWDNSKKADIYTPETLLKKVSVDSVYFQATNGGITFGGGEPLMQSKFISDFIDIAPKQWNYCVETSLSVPLENIELIVDKIDRFIVDIKSLNSDIYLAYTQKALDTAKSNLAVLLGMVGYKRITVRVPIIPTFADKKSQESTIEMLKEMGIINIDSFQYKVR